MNIGLRDCNDNMVFVGDTLSNSRGDEYKVMFGYYSIINCPDEVESYGFYLLDEQFSTRHHMPKCNENGILKLENRSRL